MSDDVVVVFDTSLRDGGQTKGVNYTPENKQAVAAALDRFGVDYVEIGWPGSSPTDTAVFENLSVLEQAKTTAFGMTHKAGVKPENDLLLNQVLKSGAKVACLFGKTWDRHAVVALGVSLEENLRLIKSTVEYTKKSGFVEEMVFDAEHFFDGYKRNPRYALACLKTAHRAGADWLVLCDTNGGTLPHEVDEIVRTVRQELPDAKLGIHAHNDSEVAVANSLMAVRAGCRMVQGTLLGIGERCGNANLLSVVSALKYKMGFNVNISEAGMRGMVGLANWFASVIGKSVPENLPYVGEAAFAHKGGVHVSAVMKEPELYEHLNPALFGNQRQIPMSDQAGLSNLKHTLDEMGVPYVGKDQELKGILDLVKRREKKGYTFDSAPESFAVLLMTKLDPAFEPFKLTAHDVSIKGEHIGDNGDHDACEAKVRIMCDGKLVLAKTVKNGPVDALDHAIRKGLTDRYPELAHMELIDFRSDLVDKTSATGAKTRVYIKSLNKRTGRVVETMGVSTNIVRASLEALVDSYKFTVLAHDREAKVQPEETPIRSSTRVIPKGDPRPVVA